MGVGNYLPNRSEVYPATCAEQYDISCDPVYRMVSVDQAYEYQDEDGNDLETEEIQENQLDWETDLRCQIGSLLGKKFYRDKHEWTWYSGTLKVHLLTWETDYPIYVTPTTPLGLRHYEATAQRLFDGLLEAGYDLSVHTGPWTSRPYQKGELYEAAQHQNPV